MRKLTRDWTLIVYFPLAFLAASGATLRGDEPADDYLKQIKPVLQARCYACHGSLKQEAGLRVDTVAYLLKGGDSGPAVVPHKPDESMLLDMIAVSDGSALMPEEGAPLKAAEIEAVARWIAAGAPAPADEVAAKDPQQHWAYQPPSKAPLPDVAAADWQENPVDRFIAARRTAAGLTPSPTAAPEILLRRLHLDLTGLPPTRDELQAFLADPSPAHYEQIVDRLLSSPRYGERWARHWMDVWRYSDWDGYRAEVRESQPHIWRWRDWIVESLNNDKPYDRMVVEMLAGDEIAPTDPDTLRATGYLVRNWFKFNRNVWLDNTVEHTGKAFLAMTFNCAKCHDHKYDPFPQQDYYQMRAFFEPYDVRTDRLPGQPDTGKDGLVRVYDAHADRPTYLFVRGNDKEPLKDEPLQPALPEFFTLATPDVQPVSLQPEAYYPGLRDFIRNETLQAATEDVDRRRQELAQARTAWEAARPKQADADPAARPVPALRTVLLDDFRQERPDLWTVAGGDWNYLDGKLTQSAVGNERRELQAQTPTPRDFRARLKFRTTGGTQWKSVGLSFDAHDGGDHTVYMSCYASGPKVQVAHRNGSNTTYPPNGAKPLPLKLNQNYELELRVRDRLLNVLVDGELQIAYTLPAERSAERGLRLWTFDAQAEFFRVQLDELSPDLPLSAPAGQTAVAENSPEELERRLKIAEQTLRAAEAKQAALEARIAADQAKYAPEPSAEADTLAAAAAQAEQTQKIAETQLALLQAEREADLARALPAADKERDKKLKAAEEKLQAQQAALQKLQQSAAETADYQRLTAVYPEQSTGRRLALAQWITDRRNPLTARVAVNHIWLRHFGKPLVDSVFEFGLNGAEPTHPQLLDWLAVEFMESGWSMKHLHRLIVTSRTYQQSSAVTDATRPNQAIDAENRLLWRMSPRRMEGEIVRDSTLFVAGSLDDTMFGPDLDPNLGQTLPRRSLYFRSSKEKKMTYLDLFDRANVVACYRRDETIIPQQALAQANSPLSIAQSRVLAGKLWDEVAQVGESERDAEFIRRAFLQVLTREATAEEQQICRDFLAQQQTLLADAAQLTGFGDPADDPNKPQIPPSSDPTQRARENLIHVLLNHNDFVTIR